MLGTSLRTGPWLAETFEEPVLESCPAEGSQFEGEFSSRGSADISFNKVVPNSTKAAALGVAFSALLRVLWGELGGGDCASRWVARGRRRLDLILNV